MNNLTELKKELGLGVRVETLTMLDGVEVPQGHPLRLREVVKVQTAKVLLGHSWLDFDSASEWEFEGDTFRHIDGRQYRIVKGEN